MAKYKVKMVETVYYDVEVECEEDEIAEAAEEAFVQGEASFMSCEDRGVVNWDLLPQ